jgi:hypothetical protein
VASSQRCLWWTAALEGLLQPATEHTRLKPPNEHPVTESPVCLIEPEIPGIFEQTLIGSMLFLQTQLPCWQNRRLWATIVAKRNLTLPINRIGELFPGGRALAMVAVGAHFQPRDREIGAP